MKLVFPNIEYKENAIAFVEEFYKYNSHLNGTGGLGYFIREHSYEDWLKNVFAELDMANLKDGKVPAITYFYVREDDGKIVGMINIRLALNDFLRSEGGHIGYCVRPTERRKHYATEMLKEALKICDILSISEIIVSCEKTNPASAGVIKNCGGVLQEELYSEYLKNVIQKYIIKRG